MPTDSTLFDALTAVQQQVLQALVAGQSHLRRRLSPPATTVLSSS